MLELYRRIWQITGRRQIQLILLSLAVAALAAVPLQFQKSIINSLDESVDLRKLAILCAGYFAVLALTSSLRFLLNFRSTVLGEDVIRRIRQGIYSEHLERRTAKAPEAPDSSGQVVTMVAAEAEDLGIFAGQAIAGPLLQIGTLISVIVFIASTQPYLGLLLLFVIIPQMAIAVSLQRSINRRIAESIRILRQATNKIAEDDVGRLKDAVLSDFDQLFEARRSVLLFKLSTKLMLNLIYGLGTVGVLFLGGWLFLQGRTDIGSVVAALTALQKINEPWRALIAFYRELSAVRVRYELLLSV